MANTKNLTVYRGRDHETHLQKSIAGATATYTLSTDEAIYGVIELTGAITANKTIYFPQVDGLRWVVLNSTSGAYTVSCGVVGGSTVIAVAQGANQYVLSTGAELTPVAGGVAQAAAQASGGTDLLGSPTAVSWTVINITAAQGTLTLSDAQASAFFLDFHSAYNHSSDPCLVTFPVLKGHAWVVRCASDSISAVRCFALGSSGTYVDVNPGYDGYLVIDDAGVMSQILVRHGNTHAAAGSDPTTSLLNPSALGTGTASAAKFLRGDQSWQVVPAGAAVGSTAVGSEPGSPATGDLDFYSAGSEIARYSGAVWSPWGPIFPLAAPPAATGQATTLNGALDNSQVSVVVSSSAGFPAAPFMALAGTELLKVTVVAGTTWTVTRGYNGTTAATHADGLAVTLQNWVWSNQGGASVDTTQGGVILVAPDGGGSNNLRMRLGLVPAAPYTLTVAFLPLFGFPQNTLTAGLCLRDSATDKIVTFAVANVSGESSNGPVIIGANWTNKTTFSAYLTTVVQGYGTGHGVLASPWQIGPCMWFRIQDDAANRTFWVSNNGHNWHQVNSQTNTNFLTPDQIGFFGNAVNLNADGLQPVEIHILSWAVTSP